MEFDFKNSAIIAPPPPGSTGTNRFNYLAVDSRDRDYQIYPTSSCYMIEFDDPYKDIVSAELVYARLPLSSNNINETNSTFIVTMTGSGTIQKVVLPKGQYSALEICAMINDILSPIGVLLSYGDNKFTFSASEGFAIDFSSPDSCKSLLGFRSQVQQVQSLIQSLNNHKIASPYPAMIDCDINNYAIMMIDNFNNMKSTNNSTNNSFALIDKEMCADSGENKPIAKKYFNPPLNDLCRLKVRFLDYYGAPYDFSEKDHYFILKLECMKNSRRYGY